MAVETTARKARTAYKTADEKAATKRRKIRRAIVRRRQEPWRVAARVALENGTPLTAVICITWTACLASDLMDGHRLGLPEQQRVSVLWAGLRRIATSHQIAFIAARAPEYDSTRGHHLHLAVHMPEAAQRAIVRLLERVTGSRLKGEISPNGRRDSHQRRMSYGVIARGSDGAWLLQKNTRPTTGGTEGALEYMTKGFGSERVQTQYRLSNVLSGLVKAARTVSKEQAKYL